MSGVRVLSERTLDAKTIKINAEGTKIEVGVSAQDGNLVEVKDDGLFVAVAKPSLSTKEGNIAEVGEDGSIFVPKPEEPTLIEVVDLAGNVLGKIRASE